MEEKTGGYSREFLVGVQPGSPYSDFIWDQKNVIIHTRFQTWPLRNIAGIT